MRRRKKVFAACANIVVLMVTMCVGAICHAVWQERRPSRSSVETGDSQLRQPSPSNHLVRVSIPWGRAEFDYPDIDGCEQQQVDEEFLESLLTACGFEYQPSYEMRECRCYIVAGLESWILIQCGIVRCKGWADGVIPERRMQMAKEAVAKLNAEAPPTIRYCIDGDLLWCESALPIEVLRRIVSLDEQQKTLRLLSTIPNEAIRRHKPELDKFLLKSEPQK